MPTSTWLALLTALTPAVVGTLFSLAFRADAVFARRLMVGAAVAALGGALATALELLLSGPASADFVAFDPAGVGATLSVYVDALATTMLVMVAIIGTVVSLFSVRYLDGDPGQAKFSQWLSFTLSTVLLVVISGNLVMLWLAWVASSFGLHHLLTFYGDRPAAQLAARKKLIISRTGDLFLLFGFLLLLLIYGTVEYGPLFAGAAESQGADPWTTLAGLFLVLGAMTKSAQLPVHSWLPDTMETPTPVSALMHAGIINAGGFLLIRLSPVLSTAPLALELLSLVGGGTAVFASVVMLTQTDIKRKLAWSTISQMGFMMLQIGLGAFAVATMHIIGHSFYKAHAFLSASSTVRTDVPVAPSSVDRIDIRGFVVSLTSAAVVVVLLSLALGSSSKTPLSAFVLGSILALAVTQIVLAGRRIAPDSPRAVFEGARNGVVVSVVYFLLVLGFEALLGNSVATGKVEDSSLGVLITGLVVAFFFGAAVLQLMIPKLAATPYGRRLYVHAYNGFYIGAIQDRFVDRVWPVRTAR